MTLRTFSQWIVFLGAGLLPFQVDVLLYQSPLSGAAFADPWFSSTWFHGSLILFTLLLLCNAPAMQLKKYGTLAFGIGCVLFSLSLVQGIFFALDPLLHTSALIVTALASLLLLVWHLGKDVQKYLIYGLLAGLSLQILPAVYQIVFGQSLGLSLMGEPVVGTDLLTTAKYVIGDHVLVRGYGTFPHPNILASFSFLSLLALWRYLDTTTPSRFLRAMQVVPIFLILLAGSKSVLIVLCAAWVYRILQRTYDPRKLIPPLFLVILAIIFALGSDFSTFTERTDGVLQALTVLGEYPWGVGIRNFTLALIQSVSPVPAPWLIVPVHTLPLLLIVELGIPLTILGCGALVLALRAAALRFSMYTIFLIPLFLVDHAFMTYHGLLILLFLTLPYLVEQQQN